MVIDPYIALMSSGRINSDQSMETARRVVEAFDGRWSEVRRNAVRAPDGAYVIRESQLTGHNRRPSR